MSDGKWMLWMDGGGVPLGECASWEDALAEAREALAEGWEPSRKTWWSHGSVVSPDGDTEHLRVAIEPEEPACSDRDGHEWADDGGPWGSGGGVRLRSVCRLCGLSRMTDTWATDPHDGSQGHEATEYARPGEQQYRASWPEQVERAEQIAREVAEECVRAAAEQCAEDPDQPGGWTGGDPAEWSPQPSDSEALWDALDRETPLVAASVVEDAFMSAYIDAALRVVEERAA